MLDAHAATAFVARHAAEFGIDPQRLAVGGDSAGGNLAAVVAVLAREEGLALAHQLLIYPATTGRNLQQEGVTTTMSAEPTLPAPPPEAGIIAAQTSESEAPSGGTVVQFEVYRSGDTSAAGTVTWAVVAPDDTYVGADSFGGTLPSGTITFAAGQTMADLPITLASGIGDAASKTLELQLSAASPIDVIGQTAQVEIGNAAPIAGSAPVFGAELVGDQGLTPTQDGNTWTFQLGASGSDAITLAVENLAAIGADALSGTITAAGDGGLTGTILSSFSDLSPTAILDIATLGRASERYGVLS